MRRVPKTICLLAAAASVSPAWAQGPTFIECSYSFGQPTSAMFRIEGARIELYRTERIWGSVCDTHLSGSENLTRRGDQCRVALLNSQVIVIEVRRAEDSNAITRMTIDRVSGTIHFTDNYSSVRVTGRCQRTTDPATRAPAF